MNLTPEQSASVREQTMRLVYQACENPLRGLSFEGMRPSARARLEAHREWAERVGRYVLFGKAA